MADNIYGIWIGENSVVAITESLTIAFLRLKEDVLTSILRYTKGDVLGVTYGYGSEKAHDHTSALIYNGEGKFVRNNDEAGDFIQLHSSDKISYDWNNKKLIYTMYDNKIFENILAEKIEPSDFERKNEIDNSLPIAEKMARWNIQEYLSIAPKLVRAGIDTRKYSVFYCVDLNGNQYDDKYNEFIYCRVGQNGYCEKGRAMFPTIQIRHHFTGMVNDNLSTVNDYKPNEDWFVVDGCSFPEDGGWYWSVKEITDDVIYLQGCGGDIYEIHRK